MNTDQLSRHDLQSCHLFATQPISSQPVDVPHSLLAEPGRVVISAYRVPNPDVSFNFAWKPATVQSLSCARRCSSLSTPTAGTLVNEA